LRASAEGAIAAFGPAFDELDFSEALKALWILVAQTDGYLTANAPWKKPADRSDADHAALQARVLATAAESIRVITALVYPILPDAAAKVWRQLGLGEIADAAKQAFLTNLAWGGLKPGTKFLEPAPLFPRAEKDAIERMQNLEDDNNRSAVEAASGSSGEAKTAPRTADALAADKPRALKPSAPEVGHETPAARIPGVHSYLKVGEKQPAPAASESPATANAAEAPATEGEKQHIAIDDFAKVDLRVAQILVAERVPKADKLLRLEVDLGYEKRQILAGIAQYYEPEKLIGRKIVIVANLAPRKMRGLESNGMLLAASLEGGAPVLAGFLEEVPLGARLK
ncbi:MAG: methionine--tRNA ligase subunit beta, partial [Terracidiphilus sp.]